ncbi:MAG: hypothetical protein U9M89_01735 [Patescibacteria group bacterium]|nr:hypothetical protein [Patescibacteria group bacterium]
MHKRDKQLINNVCVISDHAIQRYCESINVPIATDPKLIKSISERLIKLLRKSKEIEKGKNDRYVAISHTARFVFHEKVLVTYIVCDINQKRNLRQSFVQKNFRKIRDTKDRKKRTRRKIKYSH